MSIEIARAIVVGPDTPPPLDQMPGVVHGFERSLDPWHADAFFSEFKKSAPRNGERKGGWMQLDWCGNPIGFIPDGSVYWSKTNEPS